LAIDLPLDSQLSFRCDKALSSAIRRYPRSVLNGTLWKGEKNMKAQNLATNAQNTRPSRFRSDVPEERGKNVPTLDEIHRRVLEIHVERGGHGYDLDEYLEEWLQAERELREKYNRSNDEAAKEK
jgi:hypothetical protein